MLLRVYRFRLVLSNEANMLRQKKAYEIFFLSYLLV